ncbi:MAG: AAA family ATPase, partial [Thiobacillus sp.]|nr:AAA family ATPase [Thiobacillus sp.]
PAASPAPAAASLRDIERAHLQQLLAAHDGHRARVAAALGITERTLYRKLKAHGLGRD